ncbi:aminoacyl-tRNA deacylase [Lactococcus petauri]|uniref:aminoacyl-tRNA deacylase n=1 Tax=Lactococcus petauri TaxID=1940789 RepID=UPI0022DFF422|nr:aminoacyl-tRNA deacylase [Lactococcus petauri]
MSKKKKLKKTLVEQILDKGQVNHEGLALNALEEELMPEDIQRRDIYKTLALIGDKTGPIVGILPLTEHLSKKKLAKVSGNKKVHMIPQKDLQKTTGYIHGANNPVGIWQTKRFPIYIDTLALDAEKIIVSAGEVGRSVRLNPKELATFVQAEFAEIREI